MADYNSKVRSNYFKVKNAEAFRQFLDDVGLQEITRDEE
jgi:hypothetical protein